MVSEQQNIKAAKASFEVHGENAKAEEAMATAVNLYLLIFF